MDELIILNRALDDNEIMQLTKGWEALAPVTSQDKLAITWGQVKEIK